MPDDTRDTPRAVVLLSGGVDSSTCLAIARAEGFETYALTFRYGQRHQVELEAARAVAHHLGVSRHVFFDLDLRVFGGSALTSELEVPKDRDERAMASEIPVTYVPARNTIFLSVALAWAEVLKARDLFIGVNAVDYSGYPDCRPEFIAAFQAMADLATAEGISGRGGYRIHTPLLRLTKEQILRRGLELGLDYGWTHSCYDPKPDGAACGRCDSCRLRLKAFRALGVADPVRYADR